MNRHPSNSASAQCHPRGRGGFTLVEAVAVIVVLSIAFPPMLISIRQAHISRVTPARFTIARWLAAERLEDIIADRHSLTRGYGYVQDSNYPAEATISGYAGFGRSVSITTTGPDLVSAGTGYKKVTVTVTFTDGGGTARSFPLSTVVTDY
jgi:hypothetical protein